MKTKYKTTIHSNITLGIATANLGAAALIPPYNMSNVYCLLIGLVLILQWKSNRN